MKNYIGKNCWQASGFKTVCFGTVVDQKMENKWLLLKVSWNHNSSLTWEKVANLGFKDPKR
jgi:hypothetical protein